MTTEADRPADHEADHAADDPGIPRPRLSRRTGEELPPPELRALARERSEARRAQRWDEADRLRAAIEAQGWKVVDKGAEGRLVRAHPLDVVDDDGAIRYGWTGSVPVFEGDRSGGLVTIVARATPDPQETVRLLSRLTDAPARAVVLIVADSEAELPRDLMDAEVIRLVAPASPGATLAVALRRARGDIIVVGEGWPAEAGADRVPELVDALRDPQVAVAGWRGVVAADLRHLAPADPSSGDVVAVGWRGLAFRTIDGLGRGPIDEVFQDPAMLAVWWSLVLRDEGPGVPPRAARALLGATGTSGATGQVPDRASRRDRYRIIDRFGQRTDLLTDPIAAARSQARHR